MESVENTPVKKSTCFCCFKSDPTRHIKLRGEKWENENVDNILSELLGDVTYVNSICMGICRSCLGKILNAHQFITQMKENILRGNNQCKQGTRSSTPGTTKRKNLGADFNKNALDCITLSPIQGDITSVNTSKLETQSPSPCLGNPESQGIVPFEDNSNLGDLTTETDFGDHSYLTGSRSWTRKSSTLETDKPVGDNNLLLNGDKTALVGTMVH